MFSKAALIHFWSTPPSALPTSRLLSPRNSATRALSWLRHLAMASEEAEPATAAAYDDHSGLSFSRIPSQAVAIRYPD